MCRAAPCRRAPWLPEQGFFALLLYMGPITVAITCFGSYALAGNQLSTAAAYTTLAYLTLLRQPLMLLPGVIVAWVDALVALRCG